MTSDELDELILSTASHNWQKVAMVIARVSDTESSLSAGTTEPTVIADGIGRLIAKGKLVAQGNISNWRHSEIRLPG